MATAGSSTNFVQSVVQCLLHSDVFVERLRQAITERQPSQLGVCALLDKVSTDSTAIEQLLDLLEERYKRKLRQDESFDIVQQILLPEIEKETGINNFWELFASQVHRSSICQKCEMKSTEEGKVFQVNISCQGGQSLQKAISSLQSLTEDCNSCRFQTPHRVHNQYSRFPDLLFARFTNRLDSPPTQCDTISFDNPAALTRKSRAASYEYELIAAVIDSGSASSRYSAVAKIDEKIWHQINESVVETVTTAKKFRGGVPILLLYRRKSSTRPQNWDPKWLFMGLGIGFGIVLSRVVNYARK